MLADLEELLFQVIKGQNSGKYVTVSLKNSYETTLYKNAKYTWTAEEFIFLEVSKTYDI